MGEPGELAAATAAVAGEGGTWSLEEANGLVDEAVVEEEVVEEKEDSGA